MVTLKRELTTDTADQINPRIYGNKNLSTRITETATGDIYLYDLTTTPRPGSPIIRSLKNILLIYGNRIVWQDSRNTDWENSHVIWDIYMYDLSTDTETPP
jgi:beta propeller repeat protein